MELSILLMFLKIQDLVWGHLMERDLESVKLVGMESVSSGSAGAECLSAGCGVSGSGI